MARLQFTFRGTNRFEVQSRLGGGSFGEVYQVHDRERNGIVALKALRRADPGALYRFKQEFRVLADLVHPNLVRLYELLCEGDQWFFTMELVHGVSFFNYARTGSGDSTRPPDSSGDTPSFLETQLPTHASHPDDSLSTQRAQNGLISPASRIDDLRLALRQVVEGVLTLHKHGILHRDIKPANVLVTNEGRAVLFDFGLATQLGPVTPDEMSRLVGTPAYMSPEQAVGLKLSEASDWYAVGVMLYEALTGVLPFQGRGLQAVEEKQISDPVAPGERVPGVPPDLDALCTSLLRRNPADRPGGEEVLRRLLSASMPRSAAPVEVAASPPGLALVGREAALTILREAFERTKRGSSAVVRVHGSSGMGKSALVQNFLGALQSTERDLVALTGRCYERESVPYKALDSLIDALTEYLVSLPDAKAESLLPRDVQALARLFPVLRRVGAVSDARVLESQSHDVKRRAIAALRELLARVAERKLLVLFIDDLQWGDLDSASVLADILRPPDPPPLLLIVSYRTEEADTSLVLQDFLQLCARIEADVSIREVTLDELTPDETRSLIRKLIGSDQRPTAEIDAIARESRGIPFFVEQLAQHRPAQPGDETLEKIVQARVSSLPAEARRLLQALAVTARPLDLTVAREAAEIGTGEYDALHVLRSSRLIRTRITAGTQEIEVYHDRIRETVVDGLPLDRLRHYHDRLSAALEASGRADPETLAIHFEGAGHFSKAAHYARLAAKQASDTFAFDRAARLYRTALRLTPGGAEVHVLRVKLAEALSNGGRGSEAAQTYLSALDGANPQEALELRRLAAERYMMSGHLDDGLRVLRALLSTLGMPLAPTPRQAVIRLLLRRLYIRLRGLGFRRRRLDQISADELFRVDISYSVCRGLGLTDIICGTEFQTRHLLLALKAGDPSRIARAISFEAVALSTRRGSRPRAWQLLDKARSLVGDAHAERELFLTSNRGIMAMNEGRWNAAVTDFEVVERRLRERSIGGWHDLDVARVFLFECLYYEGKLREYFARLPALVEDARSRGDLYALTHLQILSTRKTCYTADDPRAAEAELQSAVAHWSSSGYHLPHAWRAFRAVEFALYRSDGQEAWNLISAEWPSLDRSFLLRIQVMWILALDLRARAALGAAAALDGRAAERDHLLKSVAADMARIEAERTAWAHPLAELRRAAVSAMRGRPEQVLAQLVDAEQAFERAGMILFATIARRRRGEVTGGDEGRALVDETAHWLASQGIKNPVRISDVIAPGIWR